MERGKAIRLKGTVENISQSYMCKLSWGKERMQRGIDCKKTMNKEELS